MTYSISEELTLDGSPMFTARATCTFYTTGVRVIAPHPSPSPIVTAMLRWESKL